MSSDKRRRYTVTLPPHVADKIDAHAAPLSTNGSDYLARVAIEWFARGCPPVSAEEEQLRKVPANQRRAS